MDRIYLFNYNNYYNRIVKKFDTIAQYKVAPYWKNGDYEDLSLGFKYNDNIYTTQVVNLEGSWNYLILCDDQDNIISRWFIMESVRKRKGQYKLSLKRDLVADNYEDVINAPCFIEKATVDENDPAIYNSEDMTFNQIKKGEYPLKDETNSAWIVGYIPKNSFTADTSITADYVKSGIENYTTTDITQWTYEGIKPWEYQGQKTFDWSNKNNFNITFKYTEGYGAGTNWGRVSFRDYNNTVKSLTPDWVAITKDSGLPSAISRGQTPDDNVAVDWNNNYTDYHTNALVLNSSKALNLFYQPYASTYDYNQCSWLQPALVGLFDNVIANMDPLVNDYIGTETGTELRKFKALNNQIVYDTSRNTFYKMIIHQKQVKGETPVNSTSQLGTLFTQALNGKSISIPGGINGTVNVNITADNSDNKCYSISWTKQQYWIEFQVLQGNPIHTTLGPNRYHLYDQPYDMFCIPYSDDLTIWNGDTKLIEKTSKTAAINIAQAITQNLGDKNVYDLQLLPYCPVTKQIVKNGKIDVAGLIYNNIYSGSGEPTTQTEERLSVILWAPLSSQSFSIYTSEGKSISSICQVTDKKIENETDLWRLCSPNFNGQFDFSPAMNNGVDHFEVDISYKPFSPYIHINPYFNEGSLYGQEYNDARGLICGGDFSLPQVTNEWANYQQNNKNYQQIFNRGTENLKVTQKYQRTNEIISGVTGALGAGVVTGNLVGGLIAGAVSGVGAGIDIARADSMRQETLDYRQDLYNYQLGNIQAIPNSISKVSPYNPNNKIFPILEYYTCTDTEKQALKDKIKYNGMKVGRIGYISQFIKSEPTYIKGKIIRLEIPEDNNYLNELTAEIDKGVFI